MARHALPTGTVTFLLTDIEGSTALWERDPGGMAIVVERHYEILDEVVVRHGGVRPDEQGEGDSVVAVFVRASDAAVAALEAHRALSELGLAVRMALHTGESDLRGSSNYFGSTIIRCARLRAIGHGGQILVSDATRTLIGDHPPETGWLRDLGSHRLKDLGRPERVWQLCPREGRVEYPPLRSLDAFGHNLPTRLTAVVGRQAETAEVSAALAGGRLVTLVGSGGVGKTRLALQVAAELVDQFDGGVWWTELAAVTDSTALAGAVLTAMGMPTQQDARPVASLDDHLEGRSALFVLDNCEHLISAAALFVDELLGALPAVSVLATSREPLGVDGETVWRVPSLDLPARVENEGVVESVGRSDAGRLFVERARQAHQGWELTEEAAPAVARICHRLDGIPLSIELAAARCRSLGVQQIARELDDRFRLLSGGARTVLARQQTLKASIDWSHELLDSSERAALRRLGVFAGPFDVTAAEAVISAFGDVDSYEVFDLVDRLAAKSLIAIDQYGDDTRYRLLETIRHYALDRLAEAGEIAAARDAHADHWATWAESHNVYLDNSKRIQDALLSNLGNLTAAAQWACAGRPDLIRPLILSTGYLIRLDDAESAGQDLFELALTALDGIDDIAWAYVAMAASVAIGFTWLTPADEAVRRRADYLAEMHDLRLVRAMLRLTDALLTGTDPAGLALASGWFAEAGSPSWSATAAMYAARYYSSVGQLDVAQRLLDEASDSDTPNDFRESGMLGARAHVAYCRGQLGDLAERTRRGYGALPPLTGAHLSVYMNLGYEVVARIAFFAADRESLEWAATELARVGGGRVPRRIAAIASAHVNLFDGPRADPSIREAIDSTLRQRVQGSAIGGGFMQRETPYLSVAAADVEWIASERAAIEQFVDSGNDVRVLSFMHMLDAVLALYDGDDERATGHWHDLLAISSERGFGLLWIDALEGLAICAARAGASADAAHLSGAAQTAREQRCYRYRYPHLDELPPGSDEGRALSLEDATTYARRARGQRARPASGWTALTPTEIEVANAVAAGLTNQQAAERLFMSVPTVKTHLRHIFDKLAISNRAQLVGAVIDRNR